MTAWYPVITSAAHSAPGSGGSSALPTENIDPE